MGVIRSRIRRQNVVQTLSSNRLSRYKPRSASEASWCTTKSVGVCNFLVCYWTKKSSSLAYIFARICPLPLPYISRVLPPLTYTYVQVWKARQKKVQYCLIMRPDTAFISDRIPPYYAAKFPLSVWIIRILLNCNTIFYNLDFTTQDRGRGN